MPSGPAAGRGPWADGIPMARHGAAAEVSGLEVGAPEVGGPEAGDRGQAFLLVLILKGM